MTPERHSDLQWGDADQLTKEEMAEGWHWCPEMDDLLCIAGGDDCFCGLKEKPVTHERLLELSERPTPTRYADHPGETECPFEEKPNG